MTGKIRLGYSTVILLDMYGKNSALKHKLTVQYRSIITNRVIV